jgi:hypothetical protein
MRNGQFCSVPESCPSLVIDDMAKKRPARRLTWMPDRRIKPLVPDSVRTDVQAKAEALIAEQLQARYIKRPPKTPRWNYPISLWTKWHKSFFYFGSTWASPEPNRISPTFELGFARMEYRDDGRFNLAYFRHTGKWWQTHAGLTLEECLELIGGGNMFTLI